MCNHTEIRIDTETKIIKKEKNEINIAWQSEFSHSSENMFHLIFHSHTLIFLSRPKIQWKMWTSDTKCFSQFRTFAHICSDWTETLSIEKIIEGKFSCSLAFSLICLKSSRSIVKRKKRQKKIFFSFFCSFTFSLFYSYFCQFI